MTSEPGIAQRLQDAFWLAGEQLMAGHCAPWELDEALADFGYGIGPCEAQDLVGLDVVLDRRCAMPDAETTILARMVAEGRLGKKGGWGYYRYPGGGGAVVDPLLEDLIREEAWFAKRTRSDLLDADIVARMNAALANAAAEIVGEGIADAAEVDRISVAQLHFDAARGGILGHADRLGAAQILSSLDDAGWTPCSALSAVAARQGRFHPA